MRGARSRWQGVATKKEGLRHEPKPLGFLAEVHGNRTHLGGYQPPTLDLKSRRPTSDLRTSKIDNISKGLMNVKVISQPVSMPLSLKS